MALYSIDTPAGVLEIDHSGDPSELAPAVKKWVTSRMGSPENIAAARPSGPTIGGAGGLSEGYNPPEKDSPDTSLPSGITSEDLNRISQTGGGVIINKDGSASVSAPSVAETPEEEARRINNLVTIPKPQGESLAAGLGAGAAGLAEGLLTKENLGIMAATAGAGPIIHRIVGGIFGGQMLRDIPNQYAAIKSAKTPREAGIATAAMIGDLVLGVGGVTGAGSRMVDTSKPAVTARATIAARSAKSLKAIDEISKDTPETAKIALESLSEPAFRTIAANPKAASFISKTTRQMLMDEMARRNELNASKSSTGTTGQGTPPAPPTGGPANPTTVPAGAPLDYVKPELNYFQTLRQAQELSDAHAPLTAAAVLETAKPNETTLRPAPAEPIGQQQSNVLQEGGDAAQGGQPQPSGASGIGPEVIGSAGALPAAARQAPLLSGKQVVPEPGIGPQTTTQYGRSLDAYDAFANVGKDNAAATEPAPAVSGGGVEPTATNPLDFLNQLNKDIGEPEVKAAEPTSSTPAITPGEGAPVVAETAPGRAAAVDPAAEKMVNGLKKLGRVNRDSTAAVEKELNYYSDEERAQLAQYLGTADAEPETLAVAITGRGKIPDVETPSPFGKSDVTSEARPDNPDLKQAFGEDYQGGPGAMGPREAEAMREGNVSTALKRAVVDAQAKARGEEPIPTPVRLHREEIVRNAEDVVDADSTLAPSIVSRIVDQGDKAITEVDAAVLLVERQRLMNERALWEEKMGRGEDVEAGREKLADIQNQLHRLDLASRAAGSTWSDVGRMYQNMLREDYTLDALERKARSIVERPLTPEESAKLKEQADRISALEKELAQAQERKSTEEIDAGVKATIEATINELGKEYLKDEVTGEKIDPRITSIAEKIVKGLENQAESALARIRARRAEGRLNSLPVEDLADYAIVGAAKIARGTLDFGKWSASMIKDIGDTSEEVLREIWGASNAKIDELGAKTGRDAEKVKRVLRKPAEPTTTDITSRAKADAVSGEPLSQRNVADAVKAVIKSGVHGENEIMTATHGLLKDAYPDLTERDVRRIYSDYGKMKFPSKEAVAAEMRELRALVQKQESIDRLKAGLDALHTGLQRDKATQAIREKTAELNELLKKRQGPPSPEKLASREEAKQTELKNRIADLDKQLRTGDKPVKGALLPDSPQTEQLRSELGAMREKLKEIQDAAQIRKSPAEIYNATRIKAIEKRLSELKAKNAAGDFSRPIKPPKKIKGQDLVDAEFALAQEKKKANEGLFNLELSQRSKARKTFDFARDVLNTARAAMTSFDLSAVLRQGGFIVMGHPVRAAKALIPMFKAMASEKGEFAVNQEIQSRPNAGLYKEAKLFLHDPGDPHLSKMEEAYMSRWSRKIPGVSHSERAYTTFLNRLRADSFDALAKSIGRRLEPEEAKALANYVNVATGRGNLASASGAAISLNTAFFSPRFVVSRFELLAGQPLYHGTAATRIAVAKEYARFLGGIGVVYALAQASGATVEKDPRSSDFGKLKFGNTRVDPLSGLSQSTVLLSRLATGKTKSPSGMKSIYGDVPFGQPDAADVAGRFLRTKLSPVLGTGLDVLSGKNVVGQPVTAGQAAARMVVPLSIGDIHDAMLDQGIPRGTVLGLLALFGMGVNAYQDKKSGGEPIKGSRKIKVQ